MYNHLPSTPIKRQLFCGGHGKPLLHSDSHTHKFSCLTIENLCRIFECFAPRAVITAGLYLKRFAMTAREACGQQSGTEKPAALGRSRLFGCL
jgi:hypothetical protein